MARRFLSVQQAMMIIEPFLSNSESQVSSEQILSKAHKIVCVDGAFEQSVEEIQLLPAEKALSVPFIKDYFES